MPPTGASCDKQRWQVFCLPERAASVAVDVRLLGGDETDEERDATKQSRLLFDRITVVAQMLKVSGRVCLHHSIRVVQKGDHFVKVRVTPSHAYSIIETKEERKYVRCKHTTNYGRAKFLLTTAHGH